MNASWFPDFIRQYHDVDVGVAVQTPGGLMVPVVRDADLLGLAEIGATVRQLAEKARRSYKSGLVLCLGLVPLFPNALIGKTLFRSTCELRVVAS